MPMRTELYPANWQEIATAIKEAANWSCQSCAKQCRRPGEPFDTHRHTLTVAHWDHEPSATSVFLVALCAPCHLRHDAPHKAKERKKNR